jgi:protein tyrosine/serine phosphatase
LSVAVAMGGWWFVSHRTYHLATVYDGILYRDGNQSLSRFEHAVEKVHPRTVVMLVEDQEINDPRKPQFKQEMDYLARRGVNLQRIPIPLGGWPSDHDVRNFLRTVSQPGAEPTLVHCAQGVRRTGMMVAAYQMSIHGYDKEKAKAAIQSFGHSEKTIADVKRFIDVYDPAAQRMTEALGASDVKE